MERVASEISLIWKRRAQDFFDLCVACFQRLPSRRLCKQNGLFETLSKSPSAMLTMSLAMAAANLKELAATACNCANYGLAGFFGAAPFGAAVFGAAALPFSPPPRLRRVKASFALNGKRR